MAYLKAQPRWTLLRVEDLNSDDQVLWLESHKALCPGFAVARLQPSSRLSYAVALLDRKTERQQFVLLRSAGDMLRAVALAGPNHFSNPAVVWTIGPGELQEWDSSQRVTLRAEGVVLEQMEANATVFYLQRKRLRQIVISD